MPAQRRKAQADKAAEAEPQKKAASAKSKAAKPEPKKAEPKKPESKKAESKKAESAKAKPKPAKPRAKRGGEAAEKKAAPQGRRSREAEMRPIVRAQAKYVRSSARKARLVIEHLRGKSVEDARAVLRHTPRGVARDLEKLLNSAVANAENNHELVGDDLLVKEAHADEGPTIKRFRPRAQGRATSIRKRTSHLTLTLTPKE
jgi:ribosomal protein L22